MFLMNEFNIVDFLLDDVDDYYVCYASFTFKWF